MRPKSDEFMMDSNEQKRWSEDDNHTETEKLVSDVLRYHFTTMSWVTEAWFRLSD